MFFIPIYIFILFFTILIDYGVGLWLHKETNLQKRKYILWLSVMANVGVLAVFKYYNFFIENINQALSVTHINSQPIKGWEIILPIGLSFHTFQAMSYTFEIYYNRFTPEKHLGIYALYVMYYPQLVAGPIERPQNVLPQFHTPHFFNIKRVSAGLQLMVWGLLKKVVIADRLGLYVDDVYKNYNHAGVFEMLFAAILFSIQIYCDFSGYSDIALGSSKVMGINLMNNFNRPYISKSISEFWSRWHVSLSTWFRDYLYIPLGGNRTSKIKWIRNLIIVFLVSGLWHGANWTFVLWGLLHAVYTLFEIPVKKIWTTYFPLFKKGIVFSFFSKITVFGLVTIAWILFRAETIEKAFYFLKSSFYAIRIFLFYLKTYGVNYTCSTYLSFIYQSPINVFMLIASILLLITEQKINVLEKPFTRYQAPVYFAVVIVLIAVFGVTSEGQFIYFQF